MQCKPLTVLPQRQPSCPQIREQTISTPDSLTSSETCFFTTTGLRAFPRRSGCRSPNLQNQCQSFKTLTLSPCILSLLYSFILSPHYDLYHTTYPWEKEETCQHGKFLLIYIALNNVHSGI